MGQIFKADIFSVSAPKFWGIPTDRAATVCSTLAALYPQFAFDPKRIEQAGGLEINSNNFRIRDVNEEMFVLKRVGPMAIASVLTAQCRISEALNMLGVALPEIVSDGKGRLVSTDVEGKYWILTRYVDGSYFTGDLDELINVGREIGRLQHHLDEQPPENLTVNDSVDKGACFQASFARLMKCRSSWVGSFPSHDAALLTRSMDALAEAMGKIRIAMPHFVHLPRSPCHFDLHPHNILVNERRLAAFMDIDSLQVNSRALALAFSTFKLVRQHAVYAALDEAKRDSVAAAAVAFVESVMQNATLTTLERESFEALALFEVFRRILLITGLNLDKRDTTWNRVLPMHLAALHEIPIIFARLWHAESPRVF